ncbi:MAG: hypothetical protein ACK55I_03945, partial [bacterium]
LPLLLLLLDSCLLFFRFNDIDINANQRNASVLIIVPSTTIRPKTLLTSVLGNTLTQYQLAMATLSASNSALTHIILIEDEIW